MQVKSLFIAVFWTACALSSYARDKITSLSPIHHHLKFIKNSGQVTDQRGSPRSDLHSKLKAADKLNIFTGSGILVYQWQQSGRMYRAEASLIGASSNVQPVYEVPLSYSERYIGKGADIVAHAYGRLVYPDIYPNIDWVLYSTSSGHLKYDFVVHPGGKVSDIKLQYSGATAITLQKDGSLSVSTPMGALGEQAPVSYTREGKAVGSRFIVNDNIISFDVDHYNGTLIIDPELSWSTYYGGLSKDYADAVTVDPVGNTYISGYSLSADNIATTGAFQTTYEGADITNNGGDAFIAKFDCSGEPLWATYYGGEAAERAWNVVADDYGHIYIAGFTNLLSGLPSTDNLATPGSHQPNPGGSDGDLFLAKFDSTGNRIWATYYGGSGKENSVTLPSGLALDHYGHVYLCGTTNSTASIATAGSYQSILSGSNDAFLVQFDTTGIRNWATYYGGSGNDRGETLICDTAGNVYMTGITTSSNNIATTGAHQTSFGGGNDAFLVKFNSSGSRQWATYYGGSGSADEGMSLYTDTAMNIYLAGRTNSTGGIASSGSLQDTYGGGLYDAFLVKFNSTGTRQWGTYFGGVNNGSLQGYKSLSGDKSGNIFMTGIAKTTDSLATAGCFQEVVAGAEDGFIAKFTGDGLLDWATYYGGTASDLFTSVATDNMGNIYLTGATASDASIATSGSHQDVLNGNFDAFLLKFSDTSYSFAADTIYGPVTVCAGATATYHIDPLPGATGYSWILPSGWTGTSSSETITVTTGTDNGNLEVTPVYTCATATSFSLPVEVIDVTITPLADTQACAGDTLLLAATVTDDMSWQWTQDDALIAGAGDSILAVNVSGLYSVIVSKGACTDTSTAVSVTIHDLPVVSLTQSNDSLMATPGFTAYQWIYEGTDIAGAVADYFVPVITGAYSVRVTDTIGCSALSDTLAFELPTGIEAPGPGGKIAIYPNPASNVIFISAPKPVYAKLCTLDGRLLADCGFANKVDISDLPCGMYILLLSEGRSMATQAHKIVKSTQ